jgi:hypothetical protein
MTRARRRGSRDVAGRDACAPVVGRDRVKKILVRSVVGSVVSDLVNVGVEQRLQVRTSEQIADQSAAVVRSFVDAIVRSEFKRFVPLTVIGGALSFGLR